LKTVNVAKEFTRFPSGRFKKNGDTSGEGFRERFLEEPIHKGEAITVELDGTIGYGSSFLEEAFGGLVRALQIRAEELKGKLHLISSDPSLLEEINGYIEDAGRLLKAANGR
jgi:STAS-like domain of unknown function (DUF4325)